MNASHPSEQISNQKGLIGYWADLKKYTIVFSSEGGYDSQSTCIIRGQLPSALQKEGTKVIFSGKIYQDATLPRPMMGGQQVFWIELADIKKE